MASSSLVSLARSGGWIPPEPEVRGPLEAQPFRQPAAQESRGALQRGGGLVWLGGREPQARTRAVARQLDHGDSHPVEPPVTNLAAQQEVHFLADQLLQAPGPGPLACYPPAPFSSSSRFVLAHGRTPGCLSTRGRRGRPGELEARAR